MAISDKNLICSECGNQFIFTVGEQQFFASRGFVNEPKRCPTCRSTRRAERGGGGGGGNGAREMHTIVCAQCGNESQVPFRPRGDRPVYCSDCFGQRRNDGY